jgi:hypothetical protein
MDNLYIEAYKFYKNDYAHGLVLFHSASSLPSILSFNLYIRVMAGL